MLMLVAATIGLTLYDVVKKIHTGRSMLGAWLNSCMIKGNISHEMGKRIYHVPGPDLLPRDMDQ